MWMLFSDFPGWWFSHKLHSNTKDDLKITDTTSIILCWNISANRNKSLSTLRNKNQIINHAQVRTGKWQLIVCENSSWKKYWEEEGMKLCRVTESGRHIGSERQIESNAMHECFENVCSWRNGRLLDASNGHGLRKHGQITSQKWETSSRPPLITGTPEYEASTPTRCLRPLIIIMKTMPITSFAGRLMAPGTNDRLWTNTFTESVQISSVLTLQRRRITMLCWPEINSKLLVHYSFYSRVFIQEKN